MQGILIVDKPMDWTSFDVVAKLRGVLGTRKLGHSGTLDPMATGVLPVFCGGASKAVDLQLNHNKSYRAVLKLGARTDTGDVTGTVLETAPVTAGEGELLAVLPQFIGPQMQVPPMYSAIKLNGQPHGQHFRERVSRKPCKKTQRGNKKPLHLARNRNFFRPPRPLPPLRGKNTSLFAAVASFV